MLRRRKVNNGPQEPTDAQGADPQDPHPVPPVSAVIERSQVEQALREVVAEFGRDHRAPRLPTAGDDTGEYTSCRYVIDNQPSCIAAQVCVKLGIADVSEMEGWEGEAVITMINGRATLEAAQRLVKAQRIQDGVEVVVELAPDAAEGNPWGLVLDLLNIN